MNKFSCIVLVAALSSSCVAQDKQQVIPGQAENISGNFLDYQGTPKDDFDRSFLVFSDQGSWFGYSLPESPDQSSFSGPFLMTQDNGIWSSPSMVEVAFLDNTGKDIAVTTKRTGMESDLSGLQTSREGEDFKIENKLLFISKSSAAIQTRITNLSGEAQEIYPVVKGDLQPESLTFMAMGDSIFVKTAVNSSQGYISLPLSSNITSRKVEKKNFVVEYAPVSLSPNDTYELVHTQSFVFSKKDLKEEEKIIKKVGEDFGKVLEQRKSEKAGIHSRVYEQVEDSWKTPQYESLVGKLILTLQNNWRSAAGGLSRAGLFPSYHYKWFHGFWAWDSWKHAAAVTQYDPALAKEQMWAMYDYQTPTGFIPDVVYRDNLIEENNYRDTKPPLSAWAAWEIYESDQDVSFLQAIYLKIKLQHEWWYKYRDHDQDGLSEYGSTDGTLVAAKWESGMDNAVRFDNSQLLKNGPEAFSLDQESVDLNSYLYAEKIYLAQMAEVLGLAAENSAFKQDAAVLKQKIRSQFYDDETGWFYDTSLDGSAYIEIMGSEALIPLWAGIATEEQAAEVKKKIINEELFNTYVPFPTLNAKNPEYKPDGGYWRGPTWIDQAYFGIQALRRYGYTAEADAMMEKLLHNAEGVMEPGKAIRENYNSSTGEGLEAHNFSWSAAHFLLMLLNK